MKDSTHLMTNKDEHPNFLLSSLMWRGFVTPRIMPMLLLLCCYPVLLVVLDHYWWPLPSLDVTPFEYTGLVLGMEPMPVTNVGGRLANYGVVFTNQIRNLLIGGLNYGPHDSAWREALVKWAIAFAFATKESLRNGNNLTPLVGVLTEQELVELKSAIHMPLFVINKIATLLQKARTGYPNTNGLELDGFEFSMLEGQRSLLIDHLGCRERILKTPMPFVYAVKIRRFVFMFLLLIPFSLLEKRVFILSLFFFWSLTPCYHWTVLVLSCKSHLIVKA